MYVTPEDFRGQVPTNLLDELVDDGDGKGDEATAALIRDAGDWVNGFLARFRPPMEIGRNATQETLNCLRVHTIIAGKQFLDDRKRLPGEFRNPNESFRATERFLTAVQKGSALPGAYEPATLTPAESEASAGSVIGGEIVFSDDSAGL